MQPPLPRMKVKYRARKIVKRRATISEPECDRKDWYKGPYYKLQLNRISDIIVENNRNIAVIDLCSDEDITKFKKIARSLKNIDISSLNDCTFVTKSANAFGVHDLKETDKRYKNNDRLKKYKTNMSKHDSETDNALKKNNPDQEVYACIKKKCEKVFHNTIQPMEPNEICKADLSNSPVCSMPSMPSLNPIESYLTNTKEVTVDTADRVNAQPKSKSYQFFDLFSNDVEGIVGDNSNLSINNKSNTFSTVKNVQTSTEKFKNIKDKSLSIEKRVKEEKQCNKNSSKDKDHKEEKIKSSSSDKSYKEKIKDGLFEHKNKYKLSNEKPKKKYNYYIKKKKDVLLGEKETSERHKEMNVKGISAEKDKKVEKEQKIGSKPGPKNETKNENNNELNSKALHDSAQNRVAVIRLEDYAKLKNVQRAPGHIKLTLKAKEDKNQRKKETRAEIKKKNLTKSILKKIRKSSKVCKYKSQMTITTPSITKSPKNLVCSYCQKVFTCEKVFDIHVNRHISNELKLTNDNVQNSSNSEEESLLVPKPNHILQRRPSCANSSPYECNTCHKKFSDQIIYRLHCDNHSSRTLLSDK